MILGVQPWIVALSAPQKPHLALRDNRRRRGIIRVLFGDMLNEVGCPKQGKQQNEGTQGVHHIENRMDISEIEEPDNEGD